MLTRKTLFVVAALLLVGSLAPNTYAQRWVYLGEAHVDGEADHDKIEVGKHEGTFRFIQMRVDRAPIEFIRVVVHFGNGADEVIPVAQKIHAGGVTRDIKLRGTDRVIKSVELWYARARYGSNKPQVRLFGR